MLRYRDTEGHVFSGRTPNQVVVAMRRAAWRAPGKPEYMQEVAERIGALTKHAHDIPSDSAEHFLAGLVQAGLLRPE